MKNQDEGNLDASTDPDSARVSAKRGPHASGGSSRREEANRRNAQKSTGPRTAEGKERSSQNAITHGVFAWGPQPITRGPFAEDPHEFVGQVDGLIESLAPRDSIEFALAVKIAGALVSMGRLDRMTGSLMNGSARMRASDLAEGVGSELSRQVLSAGAFELVRYFSGDVPEEQADYETFAALVRFCGPGPKVGVRDLWDGEHEPQTTSEWARAFKALVKHHWPKEKDAQRWARELSMKALRDFDAIDGLAEEIVARRTLDNAVDRSLKYEARLLKAYQALWKEYSILQERALPAP